MIAGTVCLTATHVLAQNAHNNKQVLFTYGDFYPIDVSGYDIVVLESAYFDSEDVAVLKQQNNRVLGYVSLGEVNEAAAHFPEIKELTLGKNDIWNSHILDIDNQETREALFAIFEHNMTKGLDGMFLDNIDNYTVFGPTPHKKEGLVKFLRDLEIRFPEIFLFQNAGVSILEDTFPHVDAIAKESIATDFDFKEEKYKLRDSETYMVLLGELEHVDKEFDIPIILIEYADTPELREAVKQRLNDTSWPYFIGKIELQNVPEKI
jgi:hypothetical protein